MKVRTRPAVKTEESRRERKRREWLVFNALQTGIKTFQGRDLRSEPRSGKEFGHRHSTPKRRKTGLLDHMAG